MSLVLEEGEGKLTAPTQTSVQFDQSGVSGVEINGQSVATTDSGPGFVEATIPAGRHDIRLF